MEEKSEGESVIKGTTQPWSARCQSLFSPVFLSFSSLMNILCRLLQTSHTASASLKQRRCMAGWLWWHEPSVKQVPHQRGCIGHAAIPSTTQGMMPSITAKTLLCRLGSRVQPVGSQARKVATAQCC